MTKRASTKTGDRLKLLRQLQDSEAQMKYAQIDSRTSNAKEITRLREESNARRAEAKRKRKQAVIEVGKVRRGRAAIHRKDQHCRPRPR